MVKIIFPVLMSLLLVGCEGDTVIVENPDRPGETASADTSTVNVTENEEENETVNITINEQNEQNEQVNVNVDQSTQPQPPVVVQQPPPSVVIRDPEPQVDVSPPILIAGTVRDREVKVESDLINIGGLRFDFNEPVTGTIKITDENNVNLNWIARVLGQTATLTPVKGTELAHSTTYIVHINVRDTAGNRRIDQISFTTEIKE